MKKIEETESLAALSYTHQTPAKNDRTVFAPYLALTISFRTLQLSVAWVPYDELKSRSKVRDGLLDSYPGDYFIS